MKSSEETLQILKVYDRTLSFRATAAECGCSHHTVQSYVRKRARGLLGEPVERPRPSVIDPHRPLIEELVQLSRGRIRADVCHRKLQKNGYTGSERTTRRAVARAKKAYAKQNRRVFRPWITEPGKWAQFDWADGPDIDGRKSYLFCAWLAWSRYRVVLPVRDRRQPTLIGCLAEAMAIFGGAPGHWLTDNQKAITPGRIAGLPVKHPQMVRLARHYGTSIELCEPFDPQSKGGSENCVKLAKSDIAPTDANLRPQYQSWNQLADACNEFMRGVNTRAHRVTRRVPIRMLEEERAALHTLPGRPFAAALGQERTVDPGNGLISWNSVQYSVPSQLAGEKVWVREQGDLLIVSGGGEDGWREVARHRMVGRGGRVVDASHYPEAPSGPVDRQPRPRNAAEREFLQIGPNAALWLKAATAAGSARLGDKLEEIVQLARLDGRSEIDAALGVAAAVGRFGFGDIAAIAAAGSPGSWYRADEDKFLQQGTLSWRDFGGNREENGR